MESEAIPTEKENANVPENENDDNNIKSPLREFPLSRVKRWLIYVLILFIVLFSQLDQSSINFSIKQFKEDLSLSDEDFGVFSSCAYIGKIAGSFTFMFLFNICNRKYLLIIILFMYIPNFSALIFALPKYFLFCARTLVGFSNIFLFTYFPVWCDQYGIHKYKPLMITVIQIILPFGSLLGTSLSSWLGWRKTLIIEMSALALAAIIIMFISQDYFSNNIYSVPREELQQRLNDENKEIVSLFREGAIKEDDAQEDKKNRGRNYKILITNPSFVLWVFSRAITYCPNLVLTNFLHEYLEEALNVSDKNKRLQIYTITGLVGPSIGAFLGGVICTLLGGYETIKSRLFIVITYAIYAFCSLILTQLDSVKLFSVVYGILMFIFAANNPILTGIVLTSVPSNIRATANSVNSFMYNFLGQLPAPYLYEKLGELRKDDPRFSMKTVISISVVPAVLFLVVLIIDIAKKGLANKDKEREDAIDKIKPLNIDQENKE